MKALLIAMNAKYIHSNLGIYSIRAYGIAHGIPQENLTYAEYTINQQKGEVLADIFRRKPDFVAFSCYIWNVSELISISKELHKIMPDLPIWFGGPEVSYHAKDFLKQHEWLSGVMIGEGEETFLEVYQAYENHSPLKHVKGIAFRERSELSLKADICVTPERPKLSMDALVFPYKNMAGLAHRIIYYETSRGCPFGCSYCLSSVERQVRFRSMELVEKELQFFLDQKVPQVKFVDRTFNCSHEHTMAIWRYIYEHDNGITNFHFEMSAELLNEEELAFVRKFRPGLVQFEIGVQTTNPETMRAIHRSSDLSRLKSCVSKVHEGRNIHEHLDLIAGLPYENYESFRKSFNDVHAMAPDQLQLGFLKLLKGSPMEQMHRDQGIVCQEEPPYEVLFTKWLPYEDVLRLKQVEDMTERYYNSMQFQASIPYMESLFATPFDFYQQIGAFYLEKGYAGVQQSRIQNYMILIEFLQEKTEGDFEILRQLLTFDLYARENLKSRPAFCPDNTQEAWRQKERRFYQEEKFRDKYLPEYALYDWKQTMRMTHLEEFSIDIPGYLDALEQHKIMAIDMPKDGLVSQTAGKQGSYVLLFDYQYRNPLNHQATVTRVELNS